MPPPSIASTCFFYLCLCNACAGCPKSQGKTYIHISSSISSFAHTFLPAMFTVLLSTHALNHPPETYIHFKTKNSQPIDISVCLDNNRIFNNSYTKILGLIVDNTLSWKPPIDHLPNKLSTVCYVIRSVKPSVNTNAIIMIYHSLFHAVMTYGIIFWGNSSHSTQVYKMQKRAIRIIMG